MGYLDTFSRQGIRVSIRSNGKLRLEPGWLLTDDLLDLARNHRDEFAAEIRSCGSAMPDADGEIVPDYHLLWVATDLDSFEEYDPRFGYELNCEPVYRMLDASYYAWLRHRMENARKSHEAGHLDDAAFEVLRTRFNVIHTWAIQRIGEDALRTAIRTTNVKTYVPPSEQTFAAYRKTWDEAWDVYQQNQSARNQSATRSDQARRLQHLLDTQGYAGIRSSIIEDIVVFIRDETVVVPAKWTTKVTFTMDELNLMIGSSVETVKQIYDVKQIFGGKVVPTDESDSRLFVDTNQKPQQLALLGAA